MVVGEEKRRCYVFNLTHDLLWSRDQRVMKLHFRFPHVSILQCLAIIYLKYLIYYAFNLRSEHTRPRGQRVMWPHSWIPLTMSHQSAIFGGYRPCGRRDVKFFICHEIPCDHVVRGSCVIMDWLLLIISHYPAELGSYWPCKRGDILFLICHVTSRNHTTKGSFGIMA